LVDQKNDNQPQRHERTILSAIKHAMPDIF